MSQKRFISSVLVLLSCASLTFGQEMDRVPKQFSFEAGYRYVVSSEFTNQAPQGFTFIFDYAWQLSGFHKKKASFITVPIGYTYMPAGSVDDEAVSIISYGWTVRHNLARDKKVIPWMGYALLLNQYREGGIDGKVFGHQTRFSFGADFDHQTRITPYASLEYSMTNFPIWGVKGSTGYDFIEVKLGFRF